MKNRVLMDFGEWCFRVITAMPGDWHLLRFAEFEDVRYQAMQTLVQHRLPKLAYVETKYIDRLLELLWKLPVFTVDVPQDVVRRITKQ